jgi:hypothetical protein
MTASSRPFTAERDGDVFADDFIGLLYRSDESTVLELITELSPPQRANIAAFCYQKAHLHHIGLAIAATFGPGT